MPHLSRRNVLVGLAGAIAAPYLRLPNPNPIVVESAVDPHVLFFYSEGMANWGIVRHYVVFSDDRWIEESDDSLRERIKLSGYRQPFSCP